MTDKLAQRKVLLAKQEANYGVDPVPAAINAMLVSNFSMKPQASSVVKRQRAYQTFGADPDLIAAKHVTLQYDLEMSGSGAAGTVPLYDCLMQSCGMSSTINAGVSTVYAPISADPRKSVAHYFYWDSILQKVLGGFGSWKLTLQGAALPMFQFSYTGLYSAATDTAPPDDHAQLEAFINGVEINKANTTFTLAGQTVELEKLELNLGNTVTFRDRPNAAYCAITDRKGTGTIEFAATTVATEDWLTEVASSGTVALAMTHGTVAGNIATINVPKVQLGAMDYVDRNGILCVTFPLTLVRTNGDDELSITFT